MSYGFFPNAHQMPPLIDDSELAKPLTLKLDEPASIVVRITGFPTPTVRWQVGRKRVKESPKFRVLTDGDRTHTLEISRVTRDLEQGVWVVATNVNGEDCCLVEVRTYEIVLKPRHSAKEQQQSAQRSRIMNRAGSLQRIGSFSNSSVPVKRGGSILSLKEWKQEMAIRNKMRSVDDLAFSADKASLMSGLGYSLSVDVGDSDDPDLDEQFHSLSRRRPKRPMPATMTLLVFPEVEPSRLVPVPNRSTANASRSEGEEIEDKITAYPEQTENESTKPSSKRKQKKLKKASKTSTSTQDPPTLETTQVEVEEFVSESRSLSDLEGPRGTNDEDVWNVRGEKLSDVCQKMLQMFPESKMQTVVPKNISVPETFEEREVVAGSIKDSKGRVRVTKSKAGKGADMQAKPEVKEDKEEMVRNKFKAKNARMLPTEVDTNNNNGELLVNELLVSELSANQCKLKTVHTLPINGESNEMVAVVASDLQNGLSNSDEHGRRPPKKSYSLSHPLNSEIKQQEPVSVSDVASHKRIRKGSVKAKNKRKVRSKSMSEVSQEMTVNATQENETDAKSNGLKEEQYDENGNIATVCEESIGDTNKQSSKQKKSGNRRRSLEIAAIGTQAQKKTKASKKEQNEARKSGRVQCRTVTPVEHDANRTFEEIEAFFAIRTFAEIEARTSEQVEHEASTSKVVTKAKAGTSGQVKRKAKTSIENDAGLSAGQTKNLEVEHEAKTQKKIPKTSGKVNRLSKRKKNITITGSEFSLLSENSLPDSVRCKKSFSSEFLANANDSVDTDVLSAKEITDNSGGTVTSTDIDYVYRVNLKPAAKKKKRKKTSSKVSVILKTDAVDSKKREDLRVREDLSNHKDLAHDEEHFDDSEVSPDEETIVQMDREPRSGVRRPGGTNKTFNGVRERDWKKSEENSANTSRQVNKGITSGQVEDKVEKETRDATAVDTLSEQEEDEEEFEEPIIVMDREPRGGAVSLHRNVEHFGVVEVTKEKRSTAIVGDSLNLTGSQCSPKQNSRPSTNTDKNAKQRIKKSKDSSNEDSPEIRSENVKIQEVGSRISGADNGQKSLYRNDINVLKAEESAEHKTQKLSTESRNPVNNFGPESSNATRSDLNSISPNNNKSMETTFTEETHQDMNASKKPVGQLMNTESHVEDTRRKKKSSRRNFEKAVESSRSDKCSREFLRSANSSGHLSTVSNEREVITPNVQQEMKQIHRHSLDASPQLKTESIDPKLRALNAGNEIKTPHPLKDSTSLNTIANNTEFRTQNSENNVQVSSGFTVDAAQYRLPQATSSVLNNARDQEKTENAMTNEQTLILKALAERIRSGQVEIIIVNKMTAEEAKIHPESGKVSTGSNTHPVSANLTNLLNAYDSSEKVDASKPSLLTTDEEASQSTKFNDIKFIDSDDSADILAASDQVSKLTENSRNVSTKKHIDSFETKNRTDFPGPTACIPETKLGLPPTKAHLPETKVDLLGTRIDLPVTKADLSRPKADLPKTNLDLPETKENVYTNRQKSQMQNGHQPGTLFGVGLQDTLPANPFLRRDLASNRTSERNSTSTVPCVDKTLENTMEVNTSVTRTQTSGKTELENNQKETFIEGLQQTISNPTEIRKSNSFEVRVKKLEPPKPKPRNSISDGKCGIMQQNSTKPSAFASTIIQTQHKQTDTNAKKLNTEGLDGLKIPPWNIKPTPRTNLPIENKLASAESNDAKNFEGRLALQIQPQPIPRTKLSNITDISQAQLSNHLAPNPPVLEDNSSPNRQESSESSDLNPTPTKDPNAKKTFPAHEMQAKLDDTASPKALPSTEKYSSVATQVTTTSGNDSSVSPLIATIPVEKSSKTTQVTTDQIEMSSTATQTTTAPVEKSSTATQVTPVSDKNSSISLSTSTVPSSNIGSNTTSNIALNYRPIIGTRFARSISPALTNIDRNNYYALGHRYTPFTPQHSWWNVYQRKLVPGYARETAILRHQNTKIRDGHTETPQKGRESQQINTTARNGASTSSDKLCNSTVNTQVDLSEGNRDAMNDDHKGNQHSKQKVITEQTENGQNLCKPVTSTLMPRQSAQPSTNSHLFDESNRDGEPVDETDDADLSRKPLISTGSVRTSVSTKTEEAERESSGFEIRNYKEKETEQHESSTKRNKEEYVSTVVTHEYGEVVVLYPAT